MHPRPSVAAAWFVQDVLLSDRGGFLTGDLLVLLGGELFGTEGQQPARRSLGDPLGHSTIHVPRPMRLPAAREFTVTARRRVVPAAFWPPRLLDGSTYWQAVN